MATLIIGARTAGQDPVYQYSMDLAVGDQSTVDLRNLQRFGLVQLRFDLHFPSGHHVLAEAQVRRVEELKIAYASAQRVEVVIEHEAEAPTAQIAYAHPGGTRDCALHCPATGKRSNGPCIDCSDEEYTIYLCC
jgi:hypothetical protein